MSGNEFDTGFDDGTGGGKQSYLDNLLMQGILSGNPADIERALDEGADINAIHGPTGLTPLHAAVGTDQRALVKKLVEEREAAFRRDKFGRWPSLVAAECQVSDELCDYIVAAEAAYLKKTGEAIE